MKVTGTEREYNKSPTVVGPIIIGLVFLSGFVIFSPVSGRPAAT